MRYKNNNYFIENISLDKLAIKYSTPLYCYSYNKLRSNIINFFTYFKKFSIYVVSDFICLYTFFSCVINAL